MLWRFWPVPHRYDAYISGWFKCSLPLDGRAELLARLRARSYGEMARAEAEAMKLARTHLDARFIVRDAVGSGLLCSVQAAGGEVVRLPHR